MNECKKKNYSGSFPTSTDINEWRALPDFYEALYSQVWTYIEDEKDFNSYISDPTKYKCMILGVNPKMYRKLFKYSRPDIIFGMAGCGGILAIEINGTPFRLQGLWYLLMPDVGLGCVAVTEDTDNHIILIGINFNLVINDTYLFKWGCPDQRLSKYDKSVLLVHGGVMVHPYANIDYSFKKDDDDEY